MTNEAMRVKIARTLGWTHIGGFSPETVELSGCAPDANELTIVPNFPEDLNACYEMEAFITTDMRSDYLKHLADITSKDAPFNWRGFAFVHATAPQRCEAFLRTMGLWRTNELRGTN